MLVVLNFLGPRLHRFDFRPPVPELGLEERMERILRNYSARRDEIWDVDPAWGRPLVAKQLIDRGHTEDPPYVAACIDALGYYGAPAQFSRHFVREYASAEDIAIRIAALMALGSFLKSDGLDAVWPQLSSPLPGVRVAATVAAAKLIAESDFSRLHAEVAGDAELDDIVSRNEIRRRQAPKPEGPEEGVDDDEAAIPFVRLCLRDPYVAEDLCGLLEFLHPEVGTVLRDRGEDVATRRRAVKLFSVRRYRSSAALAAGMAVARTDDDDESLRVDCVRYIGRARLRQAVPDLFPLLTAPSLAIQHATVVALGEIGDKRALGPLLNHYEAESGAFEAPVTDAIRTLATNVPDQELEDWARGDADLTPHTGYFFDPRLKLTPPRETLYPLLSAESLEARRDAAFVLAVTGDAEDAPALLRVAETDPAPLVRAIAARGAERVRR
jgi:HEAT repeat protein